MAINLHEDYFRSLMFGFQDGLVSTTGVVVGIATGTPDKEVIILASFVAVTVEASSMAAGQFSSEKAVHQMDKSGKHTDNLLIGALIMFFSYLSAGLIPILPMILLEPSVGKYVSIVLALIGLFTIGFLKGELIEQKPLRNAVELLFIGGTATIIGLIVGNILKV